MFAYVLLWLVVFGLLMWLGASPIPAGLIALGIVFVLTTSGILARR